MNLYEINSNINQILENGFSYDEETGEILFDQSDLDKLNEEFNDKIDNIACYIKNLDAMSNAISMEIDNLQKRKKINSNKAERLKEYLTSAMEARKLGKYESPKNKIGFRTSNSLVIDEDAVLPDELVRIKKEPDKMKIKLLLKNGAEVEGCHMENKKSIQIK